MKIESFYFVSLPIGNYEDITLRALRVLQESELLIVEDIKVAKKNFDLLKIDVSEKKIFLLNRHEHPNSISDFIQEIIFRYERVSLVSDVGSPVFADPGQSFIKSLVEFQVPFSFIPGANSLIAGLVLSGFDINQFFYLGFLTQKKQDRQKQLHHIAGYKTLLVLLETPYRLSSLMLDLNKFFPSGIQVAIAFSLTTNEEFVFRGRLDEAINQYKVGKNKKPFVLMIDNNRKNKHRD